MILIRIFLLKLFDKAVWGIQNFLTMEFYRKICNKCYWSNVYRHDHNPAKKTLLIIVSLLPVLFLSFFYSPTDPANSARTSAFFFFMSVISTITLKLGAVLETMSDKLINLPSFSISMSRISSKRGSLFVTNSSLRI